MRERAKMTKLPILENPKLQTSISEVYSLSPLSDQTCEANIIKSSWFASGEDKGKGIVLVGKIFPLS